MLEGGHCVVAEVVIRFNRGMKQDLCEYMP